MAQVEDFGHGAFCFCGSCKEAWEAGQKAALQLLEHQCPQWILQIAHAQIVVAHAALAAQGVGMEQCLWIDQKIMTRFFEVGLENQEGLLAAIEALYEKKAKRN